MIYVLLGLIGASMGSFVGAVTWRMHKKMDFVSDRSICEHCKHVLAWYDLLPILSWLALRGKCRYCSKPIGKLALALEVATSSLFILSYAAWPYEISTSAQWVHFSLWLVVLVGLIALFVYDIRWMLLPNAIVFPLYGIAVVMRVAEIVAHDTPVGDVLRSSLLGVLVGGGVFYALFQISKGKWIGGGDVKLGFLIGVLLGPAKAAVALLVAFYLATLLVLPLMGLKKITRKTRIPFGPFLITGLVVAMFWGEKIRETYLNLAGF